MPEQLHKCTLSKHTIHTSSYWARVLKYKQQRIGLISKQKPVGDHVSVVLAAYT